MKRIADDTGARSTSPQTEHPPTISAATSDTGVMTSTRRFTACELRKLPRPPGDYSWLEKDLDSPQRDFLFHGILNQDAGLSSFCMNNQLADALSYLCVKANLKKLIIEPDDCWPARVDFICSWAQTIDFEMVLDFGVFAEDQALSPVLQMLENSPAVRDVIFDFIFSPDQFQRALLHALRNNTSLEGLFLWNLNCDVIDDVAELIRLNSIIKRLFLEHEEGVGEGAAKRLCESIGKNTRLVSLEMNMRFFSQYLRTLLPMLEKKSGLESLIMHDVTLFEDDARAFATVLEKNGHLRTLQICTDGEGTTNAAAAVLLLRAVKTNVKLTSLSLSLDYPRADEGENDVASALGELIRGNTKLQSFSLESWQLTNTSATAIADALPFNTCMRTLHLYGDFDETAIPTIIKSLSRPDSRSGLSSLSLQHTERPKFLSAVHDIALLIRSNTKLDSIRLGFGYHKASGLLNPEEMGALSAAVQSNHTLIDFELVIAADLISGEGETLKANESTVIAQSNQYRPDYEEFISKIRANAEARKLRLGTVLALGVLAPEIPTELFEIIADKLTFRNEEAPEKSGTAAMRHLAKMAGAD